MTKKILFTLFASLLMVGSSYGGDRTVIFFRTVKAISIIAKNHPETLDKIREGLIDAVNFICGNPFIFALAFVAFFINVFFIIGVIFSLIRELIKNKQKEKDDTAEVVDSDQNDPN